MLNVGDIYVPRPESKHLKRVTVMLLERGQTMNTSIDGYDRVPTWRVWVSGLGEDWILERFLIKDYRQL